MNESRNAVALRSVEDLADAKELRAVISAALADAPINAHTVRCAVWSFVGTERRAGVPPALVISRLTTLIDRANIVPMSAHLALTRSVIVWCVEEYFGHLGGDALTMDFARGRIQARSAGLGKGSEFTARIPVQVEQQAPDPTPFRPVSPPKIRASGDAATHPKRVLVVDDHYEITASVKRLVRFFGHEVAVASDGPSALALATSFQPDCAVLDLGLSGMSGYELARRLRESFPPDRLRLIALTGSSGANARDACRAAGFDACIIKPGEIDELEELLARELPGPAETPH